MKKQFYKKRAGITIISLFFFLTTFSQTSSDLCTTWYEWPHEATDGNSVYKRTPYVPIPGIDRQYDPFVKLVIQNNGTIKVGQYCGYCPDANLIESTGNFTTSDQNDLVKSINISYPNQKTNVAIEVISYSVNKLVLKFQPNLKTN